MAEHVVIVGAGHGAGQLVASLRQGGFDGPVTLIGEEPVGPYQRPPLSKAYLKGEIGIDRVLLKPESFYGEAGIDLKLGRRAVSVDKAESAVELDNGEKISYDRLVLATGSKVRPLPVEGVDLPGVHYLRTVADADAIRPSLQPGARMVVVGGGYIGLEVAAVAKGLGLDVTVLEAMDRVMARVTAPTMSNFFESVHRDAGIDLRLGTGLSGFEGKDKLEAAVLADGTKIPVDVAVVGIGILPSDELAQSAGIETTDGIVVDPSTRTTDPTILAIGDCARHHSRLYGRSLRLESVQNALDQAKIAAALIGGEERSYDEVPWFWSDQYDLKLQIAGLTQGQDNVVLRGDPASRKFAAFYLQEGRMIAVEAVNAPPDYMMGRKLIGQRAHVDAKKLADTAVPLKEAVLEQ